MKRYIVKDNRETVELAAPFETASDGTATVQGKFRPRARVLELTDAQVQLFAAGLEAALEAGVLTADRRGAP